MASTLNVGLGKPRLLENDAQWRLRAGTLPVRTVWVQREFTELVRGQSSKDDIVKIRKVRSCRAWCTMYEG